MLASDPVARNHWTDGGKPLFKEDSMKQHPKLLSPTQESLMLIRAMLANGGMDPDQLDSEIDQLDIRHRLRTRREPLLDPPPMELMGNMEGFTEAHRLI
jgi:hypothetical protein